MPEVAVLADRYEVRELLARGGMADVHRGFDRTLEREVAIKMLRGEVAEARRFRSEMRLLATLEHPNLVRLLDAGEHAGVPFLVLALVDGPTLARRLQDGGRLTADEVAPVGRDLARALGYIHGAGVVHRDVKPSNILLAADGRALLSDFGVARVLGSISATQTGMVVGTARYLSPEQAAGQNVTPASDVYALGLVLLEALTGTAAFDGSDAEAVYARLHRDPAVPEQLPAPWAPLLRAMTAREPSKRPTPDRVATVLDGDPDETRPVTTVPLTPTELMPAVTRALARPRRFERRWLWALAALAVVMSGVAVAASRDGTDAPSTDTTTTTTAEPATTVHTTAPPTTQNRHAPCAQLEQEKQSIEAEKQRVEEQHKDDNTTREQLKNQLEEQKKTIEERKQQAGC